MARNRMRWAWSLIMLFQFMAAGYGQEVPAAAAPEKKTDRSMGPVLQPWAENPWYWSDRGKPVLLLGGSDDDNLFQWPAVELLAQLDRLEQAGGNVIRNTMSDRKDKGFEVYPFARQADGKYDLNQWNQEYWTRFERLLRETARRNIAIQIEIWDRFDYSDSGTDYRWKNHPYNPGNNINYTFETSGFAAEYPDHPGRNRQPFFFTTPLQRHNKVVLPFQQRFADKMLDHTLKYGHVLYCIDNETSGEEAWSRYWAEFVKQRAQREERKVYVTEMWDDWDMSSGMHKRTFDHPERYDYVDVSQNNHNKGQKHWEMINLVRNYLTGHPRPMNSTKIYGATGNKFGHTDQDGIERFWRNLLAGTASVRFHRPDSGLGLNDKAVAAIRAARLVEAKAPFWTLKPASQLLGEKNDNQAYLAANPGQAYVVYLPAGGTTPIDLTGETGNWRAYWINSDEGKEKTSQEIKSGAIIALTSPGAGNWVAVLLGAGK